MSDVILIDDEITEDSLDGKTLKNIVNSKGYCVGFKNKKADIDDLLKTPPSDLKLALLDLNLFKIRADAKEILEQLVEKGAKVIVLSALPKTSDKREMEHQFLPDVRSLLSKGALDYIIKSDLYSKPEFIANVIDSVIKDPDNGRYTLTIDCELKLINIKENVAPFTKVAEKKLSDVRIGRLWMDSTPRSASELILRILFEMGNRGKKQIRTTDFYESSEITLKKGSNFILEQIILSLKKSVSSNIIPRIERITKEKNISKKKIEELITNLKEHYRIEPKEAISYAITCLENIEYDRKMMPNNFHKRLDEFNYSIRELSNGLIVGRILQGGGRGNRSGIYRANIYNIELINYDVEEIPHPWKESVEERLHKLEKELEEIKALLSPK